MSQAALSSFNAILVSSRAFPSGPVRLPARILLVREKWRLYWIDCPPLVISKSQSPARASGRTVAAAGAGSSGGFDVVHRHEATLRDARRARMDHLPTTPSLSPAARRFISS